jgi:hypothetical protein
MNFLRGLCALLGEAFLLRGAHCVLAARLLFCSAFSATWRVNVDSAALRGSIE